MPRNPANHHQGPAPRPKMATAHDGSDHQAFINSLWGNVPSRVGSSSTPASKPASTSKSFGGSSGGSSRRAAPTDPIRSWTNEELVAGEKRQQDKIYNSYKDNTPDGSMVKPFTSMPDQRASELNADIARDSSYTIRNEVDRRGRAMRTRARKNNQ